MLDYLIQLDVQLLEWVHAHMHSSWSDAIVPYLRNRFVWIPLYVFIIAFMLFNFRTKGAIWVLALLFVVGLVDQTSSKFIKYSVKRLRPCHTEQVQENLDMLVPCGGLYSFTSSHAANHFGMSFFIFFTLGRVFKKIKWPVLIWAALVSFAQVYVGVHYPLDILGGALVGFVIGGTLAWYFNLRWALEKQALPAL